MKFRVKRKFKDAESSVIHKCGDVIDITKKRSEEIGDFFVEKIDEKEKVTPKAVEKPKDECKPCKKKKEDGNIKR